MKNISAGLAALAMALAMAGPAQAATINQINDGSYAEISARFRLSASSLNQNSIQIANIFIGSQSDSGSNQLVSADDQYSTSISTGPASAASLIDNTANMNTVSEAIESPNGVNESVANISDDSTAYIANSEVVASDITNLNCGFAAVTSLSPAFLNGSIGQFFCGALNNGFSESSTGNNLVISGDSLTNSGVSSSAADAATGVSNSFNLNVMSVARTLRPF